MRKARLTLLAAALCASAPTAASPQGDGAALLARFKDAVRADPVLLEAARETQSGAATAAIPKLIAYTRAYPGNAEAWYLLGMAYAQTDQQDLSNAAAMRAASIKPQLNELTRHLVATGTMAGRTSAPQRSSDREELKVGEGSTAQAATAAPRLARTGESDRAGSAGDHRLPLGKYQCLNWGSTVGFLTLGNGKYTVSAGNVRGGYDYDAASGAITWRGGGYAGWRARYEYIPAEENDKPHDEYIIRIQDDETGTKVNCYLLTE